jgi:hypothetical protein
MEKTKVWNKDNVTFNIGDRVLVFRRKNNGHPRFLKDGTVYVIADKNGDDLLIDANGRYKSINRVKVHKSYMIPIEFVRDELIKILLEEDTQI